MSMHFHEYLILSQAPEGVTHEIAVKIPSNAFYFVDTNWRDKWQIYRTEAHICAERHGSINVALKGLRKVSIWTWELLLDDPEEKRVFEDLDDAIALCEKLNRRKKVKVKRIV